MLEFAGFDTHTVLYESARSIILRATRRSDGRPVVLKLARARSGEGLRAEFDLGASLEGVGVVTYLSFERDGDDAAIVMDDVGADQQQLHGLFMAVHAAGGGQRQMGAAVQNG